MKTKCKCGKVLLLKEYNDHYSACGIKKQEVQAAVQQTVISENQVKKTVNRSTFNCPFCDQKNLDREDLVEHVGKRHKRLPGVCPICVVQPYGDPNYVSQDLAGHLKMRHKMELNELIDQNEEDEDAIL
eukprot:CAMPEP_0202961392 /NCGR_PEP_ID=MMETSP1396-20130829/5442_1 /ASSEMBLY_ACC=CAM_ASM_000872 /TAXON_ID= /ORGANISM="Pseudokeronopsis sp., Strain Brazil" /LENGTH=128 /DNA_ID=CAMNT_0049681165 /DNA_START=271 /DNA_END=657 /DNA_ORIENTATION=+